MRLSSTGSLSSSLMIDPAEPQCVANSTRAFTEEPTARPAETRSCAMRTEALDMQNAWNDSTRKVSDNI